MFRSFRRKVHPSFISKEFSDVWVELANDIYGDICHFIGEKKLHIEGGVNEQQGHVFILVSAISTWVLSESKFKSAEYSILLPYIFEQIGADLLEKYDWHPTTEKFEVYYDAHLRTLQDRPAALSERVGRINNTGSEFAKALYGEQHTLVSALTQMMMSFWNTGYLEHATEFSEANYNNYWWFVKEGQGTIKDLSSTYKLL